MRLATSRDTIHAVSDIEAAIAQIPDGALRDATAVGLKTSARLWQLLTSREEEVADQLQREREEILGRLENRNIYLLPDPTDLCRKNILGEGPQDIRPRHILGTEGLLRSVVQAELSDLRSASLSEVFRIQQHRCILSASDRYHFSLPSGAHTSMFLRLSDAFVDVAALDIAAYWVALEILQGMPTAMETLRTRIVVDNPSMRALAIRVDLLARTAADLHCLPHYPRSIEEQARLKDFLRGSSNETHRTWMIIGVASTGNLYRFAQECNTPQLNSEISTVLMYTMRDLQIKDVLCQLDLPHYQHFDGKEECSLCNAQSHPIDIDSSTYLYANSQSVKVALGIEYFQLQRPFIEKYGSQEGVLRVHYDDPNEVGDRHHAYYVDVMSLLKVPAFESEVRSKLRSLEHPPDVVFGPAHPAATRLREIAREVLNAPHFAHNTLRLETDSPSNLDIIKAAKNANTVLILDDLLISGSRLDTYNRAIREQGRIFQNVKKVVFLVMVALPESMLELKHRSQGLTANHEGRSSSFDYLYAIPLPKWLTNQDCPWCTEQRILTRLARDYDEVDTPYEDRLKLLQSKDSGITHQAFYVDAEENTPNLGANSKILPQDSSAIQVLISCASAVQQLRTAQSDSLDARSFPAPRYLAERVFSKNYSERLVWISLLRSLRSNELDDKLKSYLLAKALALKVGQDDYYILKELAIAGMIGFLGSFPDSPEATELFRRAGLQ